MEFVTRSDSDGIATLVLARGKVNALNRRVVEELRTHLEEAEADASVRAIVLGGQGAFFSFGFDVPVFLPVSQKEFARFVVRFTELYTFLFSYPKPVVAGLNGHAIAGGCMLALACDRRVMASGRAKISLNEIAFGSSLLAGSVEMLRFCVGGTNAAEILYSGAMYPAEAAKDLGLVDEVVSAQEVGAAARGVAVTLAAKSPAAFASIKSLLRRPVADEMRRREADSIREFVDIWYSEPVRANLAAIRIADG